LNLEDNRVKGVETQLGKKYRPERNYNCWDILKWVNPYGERHKEQGDRESLPLLSFRKSKRVGV